jgi:branched-chain amino acid transport system substrate-binding protein
MQRIAVVQADDSFGKDGMEGAMKGFDKAGLKPVVLALADRNKPDYATIVPKLIAANAQAVLWIGSGTAVTEGIKALRAAGSAAQVITLSNNAASGFIKELGNTSSGVVVMQVLPSERAMAHPLIKEASDMAKAKGDIELSPALLEGFVATKVLVEALRRAGPKPTRAKLIAVLNDFRYDAGGGLEVAYSPQDHTGIDYVDLSIISGGRFKR